HAQRRLRQPGGEIVFLVARTLWRDNGVGSEQILAPDMLVDGEQVVAVAAGFAVEDFRLHGEAGEVAGKGIRGPAHQPEAEIGDFSMRAIAPAKVLLRARLQVVDTVAFSVFLESH